MILIRLGLCALAMLLAGCTEPAEPEIKEVPVPALAEETTLRVVHAVNSRLPRFDEDQIATLLTEASRIAREHLGVRVRFSSGGEIGIDKLFNTIPNRFWQIAHASTYDFRSGRGDSERLARAFGDALAKTGDPVEDLVAFDSARLKAFGEKGYAAIGRELARIQLEGLFRWSKTLASDGQPVISSDPYNQFMFWVAIGQSSAPYDIVITNQLVASAEDGVDVHSALRGGMSQGLTTYNRGSALGSYAFVSTFATTANDPWVLELRGGESYSKGEMATLLAYVLAHEIGHQLRHFGHPFGRTECVMNPTYQLRLRRWVQNLSAQKCLNAGYPAMVPGSGKIQYRDWTQYQ
jgi:hypothetical protein